jgi:hypothetical protein
MLLMLSSECSCLFFSLISFTFAWPADRRKSVTLILWTSTQYVRFLIVADALMRVIYCISCLRRSFSALLSIYINIFPLPNCLATITPRGTCVSPIYYLSLLIRSFIDSFLNASTSSCSSSFITIYLSFFRSSFGGSRVLRR